MKKLMTVLSLVLVTSACSKYVVEEDLPDNSGTPVASTPVNVTVNVAGSTLTSTSNGGSSSSNSEGGQGGSSSNDISSGNSSATGTGGSGNGGSGGSASAGNATSTTSSNANNTGSSTVSNTGSSSSTNNSTNSGSASNQANNSTNNSSDNTNANTNTSQSTNDVEITNEVDLDLDFDFNVYLEGDEDYFGKARRNRQKSPAQCTEIHTDKNLLCHVYDFNGRTQLASELAGAPQLGSFYMDKFDVTARSWDLGFPKLPANLQYLRENYAVRCFSKLKVLTAGSHMFQITSDDGMRLLLNGSSVISDDGLHSPRSASATTTLSVGLYDMEIQWFQGPRTQIAAELKWAPPGQSLRYVESSDMKKAKRVCQEGIE